MIDLHSFIYRTDDAEADIVTVILDFLKLYVPTFLPYEVAQSVLNESIKTFFSKFGKWLIVRQPLLNKVDL